VDLDNTKAKSARIAIVEAALNTSSVALRGRRSRVVLPVCVLALLLFAFIWHPWARHKSASAPGSSGTTLGSRIELSIQELWEPLRDLSPSDERAFNEAVTLIQQKQHLAALEVLTLLVRSNPANSSVHLARAYVLLELGNVAGALGDAKQAEESGTHTAYKCWFLARVAYLAGNKPLCRREIKHVQTMRSPYQADAGKLLHDLNATPN
jgi:hypothetical protein